MHTLKESILQLDGSQGEGGGQILRSALSLSMLLGRPFRIDNIRAGRKKPGLMRQHVTCVRAAAAVCSAEVTGDAIGSTTLSFRPNAVRAGHFNFVIGSAGSTMLVLQTVLPALLTADAPSTLHIEGGTHALAAPSTEFIAEAYLAQLARIGADVAMYVDRYGFFPSGGGQIRVEVRPGLCNIWHCWSAANSPACARSCSRAACPATSPSANSMSCAGAIRIAAWSAANCRPPSVPAMRSCSARPTPTSPKS